jgi:catechol 2,3-dioxygenase-like lactoylglutathione lyase family enzyme
MQRIHSLHHVQITIPPGEEARARAFYCDVLGLPEIEKPDSLKLRGGFWLRLGTIDIHVGTENGVDRTATKAHLAYCVDNLSAWKTIIQAQNLPIKESIPIPGFDRFECRDPFDNRVEFISPHTP